MTDWHALKVTELKEELKSRGVPLTGLKLKQQLVDKLVEFEAQATEKDVEDHKQDDASAPSDNNGSEKAEIKKIEEQDATSPAVNTVTKDESTKTDVTTPAEPLGPVTEESHVTAPRSPSPVEVKENDNAREISRDDPFLPEVATDTKEVQIPNNNGNEIQMSDATNGEKPLAADASQEQAESTSWRRRTSKTDLETQTSTRVPTPDVLDDQRKRKRRSASPPPDTQEMVRKKAKVGDENESISEAATDALQKIQAATDQAELARQPNDEPEEEPLPSMGASSDVAAMRVAKEVGSLPSASELGKTGQSNTSTSPDQTSVPARDVAPAIHPPTQTLYIRNFKRPLHIPTLRNHISTLAISSEATSNEDPIKLFFLDNIRTHAFISFRSLAAASKVRNAMHETRFPDEPMREPLWIDFIPDEKVQEWIDQESASTGGFGSRTGRKFEVQYDASGKANLSLLDANEKPTILQQRSRPEPTNQNPTTSAPGVHPDRAALVAPGGRAQAPSKASRSVDTGSKGPRQEHETGKGFKALDELFESTSTKPKLYYKVPERSIIDERLDMIGTLRLGHGEMGKSGDEGMKRYTFEKYGEGSREEWVDKGPEFGFGRKGQDRLAGFRGRGGGGGGFRGSRRGGDSWRGR